MGDVDLESGQGGGRTGSYMSLVLLFACSESRSSVIASMVFSHASLLGRAHHGDSSRRFWAGELASYLDWEANNQAVGLLSWRQPRQVILAYRGARGRKRLRGGIAWWHCADREFRRNCRDFPKEINVPGLGRTQVPPVMSRWDVEPKQSGTPPGHNERTWQKNVRGAW